MQTTDLLGLAVIIFIVALAAKKRRRRRSLPERFLRRLGKLGGPRRKGRSAAGGFGTAGKNWESGTSLNYMRSARRRHAEKKRSRKRAEKQIRRLLPKKGSSLPKWLR